MSKVDVSELACLYGMDGLIPDRTDWLEFVDSLKQYTRHVLAQAAKSCDELAAEYEHKPECAGMAKGCAVRVRAIRP